MRKKSLMETNPYLHDPEEYRRALITNVSSSTAIETGDSIQSVASMLTAVANDIFTAPPPKKKNASSIEAFAGVVTPVETGVQEYPRSLSEYQDQGQFQHF